MKTNTLKKINPALAIRSRIGLENTASAWTLHLVAPLFTWNPPPSAAPNEGENKKKKSHLVQGELFPDQLADGSLKRPQPVALLEA